MTAVDRQEQGVTVVGGRYAVRAAADELGPGLYQGFDLALERSVDLGVLPELDAVQRAELEERLRRWVQVSHPGLLPLYDSGDQQERACLVFAHTSGVLLAERIPAGPIAVDLAVSWARTLLGGLAVLHAAGSVHGAVDGRAVVVESRRAALMPVSLSPPAPPAPPTPADDVSGLVRLLARMVAGPVEDELAAERQLDDRLAGAGEAGRAARRLLEAEVRAPGTLDAAGALAILDDRPRQPPVGPTCPPFGAPASAGSARPAMPGPAARTAPLTVVPPADRSAVRRALLVFTLACLGALLGVLLYAATG